MQKIHEEETGGRGNRVERKQGKLLNMHVLNMHVLLKILDKTTHFALRQLFNALKMTGNISLFLL